jgi:hypothetical protein
MMEELQLRNCSAATADSYLKAVWRFTKHYGKSRDLLGPEGVRQLSFAKNAAAGIALRCNAFITAMQAAKVRNLDDPSDTRELPCMWTLLVES